MRRSPLARLRQLRWRYPRPVTTAAVLLVALLGALLARAVLPQAWRPDDLRWVLLAGAVSYVVLRLDAYTGWGKRFKHGVMDAFGGDVDDAQTWALATLAGAVVLAAVAFTQRAVGT